LTAGLRKKQREHDRGQRPLYICKYLSEGHFWKITKMHCNNPQPGASLSRCSSHVSAFLLKDKWGRSNQAIQSYRCVGRCLQIGCAVEQNLLIKRAEVALWSGRRKQPQASLESLENSSLHSDFTAAFITTASCCRSEVVFTPVEYAARLSPFYFGSLL
jgi:hypothetical protein